MTEQTNETPLDLGRLREVAEGATPGSWEMTREGQSHPRDSVADVADERGVPVFADCCGYTGSALTQDAEHIATFDPPTVLALIERLERAEMTLDQVRSCVKAWEDFPAYRRGPAARAIRRVLGDDR